MRGISLLIVLTVFSINTYSQELSNELTQTAYIVVADSSDNYTKLHTQMLFLSDTLNIPFNMLDRIYCDSTNSMILHPQHVDKIYAGTYYPRRSFDTFLSIENVNYYSNNINSYSMMIVLSITAKKKLAIEQLKVLQEYMPNAFILKTQLYMGCMH